MPKFAIVATLSIAPGRIEEYLPIAMAHRARCLRDEPGTLQFEVLRVQADETKVMLYEVYRDQAAFDAHWAAPSLALHREEAGDMLLSVTGARCTLLD